MADYTTFRQFSVALPGRDLVVWGKPGVWSWDGLDPGTAALLDAAGVAPGDEVLDLGCGTGVIGAAAGIRAGQGRVVLVDCNAAAVACAERTLAANGLAGAEVRLADGVAGLSAASFDLVLSHLPRGRAVQEEMIRGAAWALRPGGRLVFCAHKRAGVKGAVAYARRLFGRCGVVRQRKGYHVALAVRPDDAAVPPPGESYVARSVVLDGAEATLVGKPGVFAWDRVDAGTAALVAAMEIGDGDRVLDLGCGTGLVGLAAARRAAGVRVVLVDADLRAVEAARRTLGANGVTGGEALLSDCGAVLQGRAFDVVATNPPFHQGVGVDREVAHQFVRDAARLLAGGGRFWLVANRFLPYSDLVRECFGSVATAYADGRYHVLEATV